MATYLMWHAEELNNREFLNIVNQEYSREIKTKIYKIAEDQYTVISVGPVFKSVRGLLKHDEVQAHLDELDKQHKDANSKSNSALLADLNPLTPPGLK